tara:strand:- start:34 stop:234 length:201 start_codon:yes stop_codon:yes gene_type:complete
MPWQTAPGLIIIAGAFTVAGGLVQGVHWLFHDKPRQIGRNPFMYQLENRDKEIKERANWRKNNNRI